MQNSKKKAQSLIEYGLILALVAIIALTVLGKLGKSVTDVGNNASNAVSTAANQATDSYCASIKAGSTYDTTTGTCK